MLGTISYFAQKGGAMASLRLLAHAKINLSIDVTRRLYNGYHEVDMLMQSLDLADELIFETNDSGRPSMSLEVLDSSRAGAELTPDEDNLVMKSALLFFQSVKPDLGVHIHLIKRIPMAAGLGGGSADAAATLLGLSRVLGLFLSDYELWTLGRQIGADVPFCLRGGLMRCQGIGELLTPVQIPQGLLDSCILLTRPHVAVSTPTIYRRLDEGYTGGRPDNDLLMSLMATGPVEKALSSTANVLEAVTSTDYPLIGRLEGLMADHGAYLSMMSGSGPTVYGLFADPAAGERARDACSKLDGVSHSIVSRACCRGITLMDEYTS